ncbi:esterase-like activity of phytase family protein [Actinomycetospora flava]|uniref:Esterase-like activity of phytase family protein n=1 Tax=Actinomycetospora flava TaxID=3129232 RepID=A0ABU8M0J9_9PSEU
MTRAAALALLLIVLAACGGGSAPGARSAAVAPQPCSPSVAITGFSDALDGREYGARRTWPVAGLSGLAVDRDGTLLALSDRSVLFTLDPRTREPTGAFPLADGAGDALDAEGLAVDAGGTRLVTSETEPAVYRFDPSGRLLGRLDVPADVADRASYNSTLEGVAVLGDGAVVAAMEGPLDGDDPGVRRFLTWPGPGYTYRPDPGLDVSDLTATGDGRLLVLERSYTSGVGNTVHLALADPRGDPPELPRTLLADLGTCPSLGAGTRQAQTNPLLDNIEGMTVLGRTPDGALRVLLVSDDNLDADQTTRLYDLLVRLPPA